MPSQRELNWEEILLRHPLFLSLNQEERKKVVAQVLKGEVSEKKFYLKDEVILKKGDPGDSIFLVGLGSVRAVLSKEDDQESDTLAILKEEDFFGEIALFEEQERSATVLANEECSLLEIKGHDFLELLEHHPGIVFKVLAKLSERIRRTNELFLSKRIQAVDEVVHRLKDKLDAEIKAVDRSLRAAHTVFDQTMLRTEEVISHAERSRAQLSTTLKIIVGVATLMIGLLGFLGIKEYYNVRSMLNKAKKSANNAMDIENKMTISKQKIEEMVVELKAKLKTFNEDWDPLRAAQRIAIVDYVEHILLPEFQKGLETRKERDTIKLYERLREFLPSDPKLKFLILDGVEYGILEQFKQGYEADYTLLLELLLADVSRIPKGKMLSYYLLLVNAILIEDEETFEKYLPEFKEYAKKHQDKVISEREWEISTLDDFFSSQDERKRKLFGEIRKLLPIETPQ
jgi:CRP-like cAMP-binding protein